MQSSFKDTIYLCKVETEQKRLSEENRTKRQLDMCSWGYKFEQYVLSDNINPEPDLEDPFTVSTVKTCRRSWIKKVVVVCRKKHLILWMRMKSFAVWLGPGWVAILLSSERKWTAFGQKPERANEDNRDMLDLNSDGTFVELKTSRVIDKQTTCQQFCRV